MATLSVLIIVFGVLVTFNFVYKEIVHSSKTLFKIMWLPVNQAWAVMFGDSILRIFNNKVDAEEYLDHIENK